MTRIRDVRRVDLEAITGWRNDPEVWRTSLGRPFPITSENTSLWFESLGVGSFPTNAAWSVTDDADGLVGLAQLAGIHWVDRTADFGIWIGPEHRGDGHGRRATELVVSAGFADLGLRQVRLRVIAGHRRALDIYRGAGFVSEGLMKAAVLVDGVFEDVELMRRDGPLLRDSA